MTSFPTSTLQFLGRHAFAACLGLSLSPLALGGTLYYAFEDAASKGGIAKVEYDVATGAMSGHEILWSDATGMAATHLALNESKDRLLLVCDAKEGPNLHIFDLTQKKLAPISVEFGARPDNVAIKGDLAFVGGYKAKVVAVDLKAGRITNKFEGRKDLTPPGQKAEDLELTGDGKHLFVTFQGDSDDGKFKGNRVIVLSVPDLKLEHDISLPRDRADLHPKGSVKEAGPSPENILIAPNANAVVVSLDVYGAAAIADLDAFVDGKLKNLSTLPTALDQSFGTGFPDRLIGFNTAGKDYAALFNCGEKGGLAILDVKDRSITQRVECAPGVDEPIFLKSMDALAVAHCGKTKKRTDKGIERDKCGSDQILIVDLKPLAENKAPTVRTVKASAALHRLHAIDGDRSTIAAALLKVDKASKIASIDLASGKELGLLDCFGKGKTSVFKP